MKCKYKCPICDREDPATTWTDTHGVAQCECGTPVKLLHYEGDTLVDLPPRCIVADEWVAPIRSYWERTKSTIPSGCSVPGGQELATSDETVLFYEWMKEYEATK